MEEEVVNVQQEGLLPHASNPQVVEEAEVASYLEEALDDDEASSYDLGPPGPLALRLFQSL